MRQASSYQSTSFSLLFFLLCPLLPERKPCKGIRDKQVIKVLLFFVFCLLICFALVLPIILPKRKSYFCFTSLEDFEGKIFTSNQSVIDS